MPAATDPVQRPDCPLISIILPCLDEEPVLRDSLPRLGRLAASHPVCRFEFVFVDDGSRDRTADILRVAAGTDPRVRVLRFTRTFGQQFAVSAGIEVAKGDAMVLMDADLQDPPELEAQMLDRWRHRFGVVYGIRASRRVDSL